MNDAAELEIAKAAFAAIQARVPWLSVVPEPDAPVELSISFPVQPRLSQKVWLGFQNKDELHFSVGHFWLEWFPCTNPSKVREYVEAVVGYLSGEYRVIEHYRGARCVKAQLQAPVGAEWQTVGTWSTLLALIPGKRTSRVLRNDAQPGAPVDAPALRAGVPSPASRAQRH